ncbi:MAG TPA: xanthine dehydrogenase family protein molybdopterin-binding subunit [Gemmatimonadales bacterium]|nr:xanthine dehydrogenase family protein molybdopterin-binding subunit [Gemmatimonadales bacterium]
MPDSGVSYLDVVGRSVPRRDGPAKVAGTARYVDDIVFPGMLHGRTVRSTISAGRITAVTLGFDPAADGFTVVDWRDIPGSNVIYHITDDQPCLVEREVRHAGEPVLLLAHENRDRLLEAPVSIEYERHEPLLDPLRSTTVHKQLRIEKGNTSRGFAAADLVVEGEYRTGHQEHVYIETNGFIAVPEPDGGITVYGSLQCPFYVHKALKHLLNMPDELVRVVQTEPGGGFGGKEEYPSMIAGHAALLALKAKRPVKIVYDRAEDMYSTTKRHPSIVRHRTGVTKKGQLVAMEIDVLLDGGAYVTLSPVVLSRACIHAAGPYRCPHVRIEGRAVFTNTNPNGAFRGFGAPQSQFALEVHMDRIAEALGMDPAKLRAINALRPGDTTATGQRLGKDASAQQVLREALRRSGWSRKRKAFKGTNRGIGMALFFHGSGFTGAGEVRLASRCSLATTETGVKILVASTEIGQGTRTMHAQIVAEALGITLDEVEVAVPDTAVVPDSGPTVASRTCMVVGKILERCAIELKAKLNGLGPAEHFRKHGPTLVTRQYEPPPGIVWDEDNYRGDAYATYSWACDVAEVELDRDTLELRARKMTLVHEFGRPINPVLAQGQIEGGTAQGVGFATIERVVMRDGAMANAQLTNYTIPTTLDTPRMDVVMLENPYPHGPFGAKGVGELPMDGPAPAIANAARSLGLDVRAVPITPEYLMEVTRGAR